MYLVLNWANNQLYREIKLFMQKFTSKELRKAWIKFYEERGHVDVGQVSLVGDGTTGVLFNVAGMQPLMPYLLGKPHPMGKRLCNVQGCVRTNDIESVGDSSHVTFFEMMGSWSLGDYFKKERTQWSYELLTQVFKFDPKKIAATVFEGDKYVPRDNETALLREQSGIAKENIYYLPKDCNWWELETGPCGPDSEMYYITDKPACSPTCNPGCDCGHFIEVGNDVFMQYEKLGEGKYVPLQQKNVDTGWGLERILAFLNTNGDVYKTDLLVGAINIVEKASNKKYEENEKDTRAMRIIVDHIRTSVMLLGDSSHLTPSNVGAGYTLRRLIRRAVRYSRLLGIPKQTLSDVACEFIDNVYNESHSYLKDSKDFILQELDKEIVKFERSIDVGLREFNKITKALQSENQNRLDGKTSFRLYDTFGFPIELTMEIAEEQGFSVDKDGFMQAFKEHQEKSRGNVEKGEFASGLQDHSSYASTMHHTATHLLNAALKIVVGEQSHQKGSNITDERLRFDFACDHKLSPEEIAMTENLVNGWIDAGLEVTCESMKKEDAVKAGAEHTFIERYPDIVTVYTIGNVSKEICTGPHVKNTSELGHFKIDKEEASSQGVRRIKASLDGKKKPI